jgi:hypothetical protein
MKYAVLALFFLASAVKADGFYIESGLAALDHGDRVTYKTYEAIGSGMNQDGVYGYYFHVAVPNYLHYDLNEVHNPYGALSIGYDWKWRAVRIDFQLQHQSSIKVNDHGQNSIRLNVRWYPFSR